MEPVDLDVRRTYELASGFFQIALAALILASSSRPTLRLALPFILLANAYEALDRTLRESGLVPNDLEWIGGHLLDPMIVMTVAFVLAQLPVPLGGPRAERAWTIGWLAALATWAILAIFALGEASRAAEIGKLFAQTCAFLLAAYLFAAHVVPRWRKLPPGPLRGQGLLLAGALTVGLGSVGLNQAINATVPGGNTARELATALVLPLLGAGVVQLLVEGAKGRRDALLLAVFPLVGASLSAADNRGINNFNEFGPQVVRPLLFAVAALRYDLVDPSFAARRAFVPLTAVTFLLTLFFGLNVAITGQSRELAPAAAAGALVLLAGGALVLQRPLAAVFRAAGGEAGSAARIERYRLALEAAGAPYVTPALVGLRRRLRITVDEHDTLVAILRSHVVVPARVIHGLSPGDRVADHYEVVRELGRGGQGRALLARADDGRLFALKEAARPWEADAEARRAALAREAEAGARIASPRVARIVGVVEDGGVGYLVREFVPGRTLEDAVADAGPMPPARAARAAADVLEGLVAIHDAGLLHLDLKPSNVVLDESGRAVIIDLGTSRREGGAAGGTLTQGAAAGGTLGWMAPEQAAGERVARATDVYAAGLLLAFLATGRKPTPMGPPPLDEGPFTAIVARACAFEPSARFASAAEMAAALRRE